MNELNQHKKSDSIKWIITFVALILLAISVVALGAKVFGEGVDVGITTEDDANKTNPEVDSSEPDTAEGLSTVQVVNSDLMMLSAMAYSAEPAEAGAKATNKIQVNATVLPEGSKQNLNWEISFVDPYNEWAEGLQVEASDFVYIESGNTENTVIYVGAYSAFGAQVKLTATSTVNPDVSAYIIVDYTERLGTEQYLEVGSSAWFTDFGGSADDNYVTGIIYDTNDNMMDMYCQAVELAEIETTYGTIELPFQSVEYYLTISDEFLALLQAKHLSAKNSDYTYLGNGEFNAALIINTICGENLIPYDEDDTVDVDKIIAFNEAAYELGDSLAFTIHAQIVTDIEVQTYNFNYFFDADQLHYYPTSIEFNVTNIVL